MKTIIKLEHDCGDGLFNAIDSRGHCYITKLKCYSSISSKHAGFNTPDEDGLGIESDEYCAFKSIEQTHQWIEPEWFREMMEAGFKIWMIDVSKYREGYHQVLFKKKDIISKKDISSLFI